MKIKRFKDAFTKREGYSIAISTNEDIDARDIAECFKRQYPKTICLIRFSKIIQIEVGLMLVGIKLEKKNG